MGNSINTEFMTSRCSGGDQGGTALWGWGLLQGDENDKGHGRRAFVCTANIPFFIFPNMQKGSPQMVNRPSIIARSRRWCMFS